MLATVRRAPLILLGVLLVLFFAQWFLATPEIRALATDPSEWGWETIALLHVVAITVLVAIWRA